MTHYKVLVCVRSPEALDSALAPFGMEGPEPKLDWWVTGGRWGGTLLYREGCEKDVLNPRPAGGCDGGPKQALDLDRMREEAAQRARETYRRYRALTDGTPEPLPWRVLAENISDGNGYTFGQARAEYEAQPRVKIIGGSEFSVCEHDPVEEFGVCEDTYARRASSAAVPGYALVTLKGEWTAPGEMRWFGSTDEQPDRDAYARAANGYIDRLPDSTWLILADAHI